MSRSTGPIKVYFKTFAVNARADPLFNTSYDYEWLGNSEVFLLIGGAWHKIRASKGSKAWELILVQFCFWPEDRSNTVCFFCMLASIPSFFAASYFIAFPVTIKIILTDWFSLFIGDLFSSYFRYISLVYEQFEKSPFCGFQANSGENKSWRGKMGRPTVISQPFSQCMFVKPFRLKDSWG